MLFKRIIIQFEKIDFVGKKGRLVDILDEFDGKITIFIDKKQEFAG